MGISGGLKQLLLVKVHSLNVWEHLIGCAITVEHFVLTKLMGRKVIHCDTSYILYLVSTVDLTKLMGRKVKKRERKVAEVQKLTFLSSKLTFLSSELTFLSSRGYPFSSR
jgi:hypothetical protein